MPTPYEPANMQQVSAGLAELLIEQPGIGQLILGAAGLQPELDPDAGSGFLTIIDMLLNIGLTPERHAALVAACKHNPYKLYVFVRSYFFRYVEKETVEEALDADIEWPFEDMLDDLCEFCPTFNRKLATKHFGNRPNPAANVSSEDRKPNNGHPASPAKT